MEEKKPAVKVEIIGGQPYIEFNSGRKMPLMGYGTYKAHQAGTLQKLIKRAIVDIGYRHIDAASYYENEEQIGEALTEIFKEGKVKREEVFVTSKIWHSEKEDVEGALRRSLDKLKLDYLDLYLIHWPAPGWNQDGTQKKRPIYKIWEELEECVKKGLVRDIGVSNFNAQTLLDLINCAEIMPVMNQIELHPYLPQTKLVTYFQSMYKIHFTAYYPVARAGTHPAFGTKVLANEPLLLDLAKKYDKTPYQIALRWGIQRGTSVIPKTSNEGRLKENFESTQFELTPQEMEKIADLECGLRGCESRVSDRWQFTPLFD